MSLSKTNDNCKQKRLCSIEESLNGSTGDPNSAGQGVSPTGSALGPIQEASASESVPVSAIAPVVQPSESALLVSSEPYCSHQNLALQELARIHQWSQEAAYLASEEGLALNQGKGSSERPVRSDGTHLSYTIDELQTWMKSSLLPEHYVVSPDLKVVNLEGRKPVELFDTLVLPLNCVLDNHNQFKGLVLVCIGYDGKPHVFTVLLDDVLHDLKRVKVQLGELRVGYYGHDDRQLSRFMNHCSRCGSIEPIYRVEQAGFISGKLIYVTHETVLQRNIGTPETKLSYQIRKALPQLRAQGTLLEWEEYVAGPVRQLPSMMFPILAMLGNVLLDLLKEGTVIVHFHGLSSGGKTTRGQLAQSVVGRATDPSKDGGSAIRKWHGTTNWLFAVAKSHHGMGLVLDELGSHNSKNFDATIYALSNGKTKGRCETGGDEKEDQGSAILCIISTGELSTDDYLRKTGGSANSGVYVRMLNIEVHPDDAKLPGETLAQAKARIDQLKAACGQYYGTALPALAQGLLNLPEATSYEALQELVRNRVHECAERLMQMVNGAMDSPLVRRGLDFFAITLTTGLYGIELGVLPYTENEVEAAVLEGANRWVASLEEQLDDVTRAATQFKNTVALQRHKIHLGKPAVVTRELLGFIEGERCYIFKEQFDKLVPSMGEAVKAWLFDNQYLERYAPDRYVKKIKVAGVDSGVYSFYLNRLFGSTGEVVSSHAGESDSLKGSLPKCEPSKRIFSRFSNSKAGSISAPPTSETPEETTHIEQF
ncbi:DUF927 domain-containing protein [Aeromonas caviae]|uniref:DUF927 domain-containing protein n=1 Tax=Aeromonas caviae TaxID=648 RepID=UPI002B4662BE|nr:DUF927 domain-containing protein [Aeromonas caviae]